jgi:hypothetical protein
MNSGSVPMEISFAGIYFPPVMLAILLAVILATIMSLLLNKLNLTRFIWHPPLFFIALTVLCTRLIDLFILPV